MGSHSVAGLPEDQASQFRDSLSLTQGEVELVVSQTPLRNLRRESGMQSGLSGIPRTVSVSSEARTESILGRSVRVSEEATVCTCIRQAFETSVI